MHCFHTHEKRYIVCTKKEFISYITLWTKEQTTTTTKFVPIHGTSYRHIRTRKNNITLIIIIIIIAIIASRTSLSSSFILLYIDENLAKHPRAQNVVLICRRQSQVLIFFFFHGQIPMCLARSIALLGCVVDGGCGCHYCDLLLWYLRLFPS